MIDRKDRYLKINRNADLVLLAWEYHKILNFTKGSDKIHVIHIFYVFSALDKVGGSDKINRGE